MSCAFNHMVPSGALMRSPLPARTVDSEGHTPLGAAVLYTLASGNAGFMEYLLASTDVDALVGVSVL